MTDLATRENRPAILRPPVGLLLSIGAEKPASGPGRSIPYFRAKPGQLSQYADAAAKFHAVYGEQPDEIEDVYFLSNDVADVLEVRLVAFGQTGLRGVGVANYAELPPDEFADLIGGNAAGAFTDAEFLFFPREVSEVRPELRENWEGEPVRDTLTGPDDPRVKKLQVTLAATLSFCLPRVMGIGTVAQIRTGGKRSTRNLYTGVWKQWEFFRGRLAGPPFRLTNRAAKTQRFVKNEKVPGREGLFTGFVPVEIRELILDTPLTVQEIYEALNERARALGDGQRALPSGAPALPPPRHELDADSAALTAAMGLPVPEDEPTRTATEPNAFRIPQDALLNRIAQLEPDVDERQRTIFLEGAFGVKTAGELNAEQADAYLRMLELDAGEESLAHEGEVETEPEADPDQESIF